MASLDIQRNDKVQVIAGSDRGKQGRVLRVIPDAGRMLVEHVRMVKKNVRANPQRNIKGGIAEQEAADPSVERDAGLPELQPADARGAQV